jgi:hypothetical protein
VQRARIREIDPDHPVLVTHALRNVGISPRTGRV